MDTTYGHIKILYYFYYCVVCAACLVQGLLDN